MFSVSRWLQFSIIVISFQRRLFKSSLLHETCNDPNLQGPTVSKSLHFCRLCIIFSHPFLQPQVDGGLLGSSTVAMSLLWDWVVFGLLIFQVYSLIRDEFQCINIMVVGTWDVCVHVYQINPFVLYIYIYSLAHCLYIMYNCLCKVICYIIYTLYLILVLTTNLG